MTTKRTLLLRQRPPTTVGFFGGPILHPAYVGVSCDECDKYGYVPEATAAAADEDGAEIVCRDCGG